MDIPIPPEVAAIFDEATESGPYSAGFTRDTVYLQENATGRIVREVSWADAHAFAQNVLRNTLETTKE